MPLILAGATSGSTTIQPTDAVTTVLTLPSTTGTLAVSGGSPSFTTITTTSDASISGLTVGKGGGSVSTNTVLGGGALPVNTSGLENVAIGYIAMASNTTGSDNVAVGRAAFNSNTTGINSIAIGINSLVNNTSGSYNVGVGMQALNANTTASSNTAVGYQAGYSITTNTGGITAVGYQAGYSTTSGDVVAMGYQAGQSNTTGSSNAAFGVYTLKNNTTGASNTAIGNQALNANTTNSNNTALGYQAGYSSTGANNLFLGYLAGQYSVPLTTGTQCVYIGYQPAASASGATSEIVLGNSIGGKGNNTTYIGGSSGVYQYQNVSTWYVTSDQRLKKNIVDNTDGLNKITAIQVRNFEYRLPEEITDLPQNQAIQKQGTQLGVIAQELQQILPECVIGKNQDTLAVSSDNLVWYLVNAVKELNAEIIALKAKVGV